MKITKSEAATILTENDFFTILCHANPDGDTLGSGYALCCALQKIGKHARVVCGDVISERFAYLIDSVEQQEFDERFVISVDVADEKLLGDIEDKYRGKIDLCIDHHSSNVDFARKSVVEQTAANAEIVYDIIGLLGVEMDSKIAAAIYTGVSTDTGCFKFPNTTPRTHIIAAELMTVGCDYARLNYILFEEKSKDRIRLETTALEEIEYYYNEKCALVVVKKELVDSVDAEDLGGLSALSRQIKGVELGVTMKEKEADVWRISLRSNTYANAQAICSAFGGGGHMRAAGCKMEGSLTECKTRLLEEIGKHI